MQLNYPPKEIRRRGRKWAGASSARSRINLPQLDDERLDPAIRQGELGCTATWQRSCDKGVRGAYAYGELMGCIWELP